MKYAAYMCLKDDAYYIDMALRSILPHIEGIYIQDQDSKDGAHEIICDIMKEDFARDKVYYELIDTGTDQRFDREKYNEVHYRNLARQKAEEIFCPDFICKFDADELVTPLLFEKMDEISENIDEPLVMAFCVGESRFITPHYVSADKGTYGFENAGIWYYGGHTLFWRAGKDIEYVKNPAFDDFFHPVLRPDPLPRIWIPGITHIHLHRTFGPKAFGFWAEGEDVFENINPFNPRIMAPKWFYNKINLPTCERVEFNWPDYVLKKWQEWGGDLDEWEPE